MKEYGTTMIFNACSSLYSIRYYVVSLIFTIAFSACVALVPPPNHIAATPSLNSKGDVVFYYQEKISTDRYFKRDNYIVTGVELIEHSCSGKKCYPKVWEVSLPRTFDYKGISNYSMYFPKKIVYGQPLNGYVVERSQKKLKRGVPYQLIIGLHGFDDHNKNSIYFSANAYFMLEDSDTKNNNNLLIWGKDGAKFDLKARGR